MRIGPCESTATSSATSSTPSPARNGSHKLACAPLDVVRIVITVAGREQDQHQYGRGHSHRRSRGSQFFRAKSHRRHPKVRPAFPYWECGPGFSYNFAAHCRASSWLGGTVARRPEPGAPAWFRSLPRVGLPHAGRYRCSPTPSPDDAGRSPTRHRPYAECKSPGPS